MGKLKQAIQKQKHIQQLNKVKAGADKRRKEIEEAKRLKKQTNKKSPPKPPFGENDKLLLVGEATAYDSEKDIREKYPSTAPQYLDYLSSKECPVLYQVDATAIAKTKPLKNEKFDVIMFNFPHIGNSMKDQARNILQHQKLVLGYYESAVKHLNPNGKIVLTLFEGEPYVSWGVKKLARSQDLALVRSDLFHWESYPGYNHRLTAKEGSTSKPQASRPARVYVFSREAAAPA